MPLDIKLLFRPEALRPKLNTFLLPDAVTANKAKLLEWTKLLVSPTAAKRKETELLSDFIRDVFVELLGYTPPPVDPYTLKREALIKVDGKFADAALGQFHGESSKFIIMLEGKGPKDPLDRPFGGRNRSAVDQALQYAVQSQTDWYLVTNLNEIRLYHKGHNTFTYERFETSRLANNEKELNRFVFLLGAERVVNPQGNHLDSLLTESKRIGRELTNDFYQEYRQLREHTFQSLRQDNPNHNPSELLTATQKILDRILFIAFCEDRELLPREIIDRVYTHMDLRRRPIWQKFVDLFRSVDEGNEDLQIWQYNGGLFAEDSFLDSLIVSDSVCEGFKKLGEYEYGSNLDDEAKFIDVEILGHIFEQSITDLEEMQEAIATNQPTIRVNSARSKRKLEGAFYTPDFVTQFIVTETLGSVLRERFETYRSYAQKNRLKKVSGLKTLLDDPTAFDTEKLEKKQRIELIKFWQGWIDVLASVRIVDPSCGSGAFLIEAFDQMFAAYSTAQGYLIALQGSTLFDVKRTILTRNIFGMDVNSEAVEIARLSSWIKTAEIGKQLTSLDANIVQGNSVICDPDPLAFWKSEFREVFNDGGFDVVIGNPPFVRQERIKANKSFLQQHYSTYDSAADLYVYFFELGLNILNPGGRLGFIVNNKWMRTGYGEQLRRLYSESAWVEQIVDFGHTKKIFRDPDVFPSILVVRKPNQEPSPETTRACIIYGDRLRIDDFSRQIMQERWLIPRSQLDSEPWELDPPAVTNLMEKIKGDNATLREFTDWSPLSGIKTGFNRAFLIDTPTKDRLVNDDPKSSSLFKPYLRGQDINRWQPEWARLWMIALKSSTNHLWPWANAGENAENIFQQTYPALHGYMKEYETQLRNREDQGLNWWELRACAYWAEFDKKKLVYPEITWRSEWCLDDRGYCINNTVYILPVVDLWVLAVINSPIIWAFSWRNAQHGKDEALRFIKEYVQEIPIAAPNDEIREKAEQLVLRLIELKEDQSETIRNLLQWLQFQFGVNQPTEKLANMMNLSSQEFIAEVRKLRGRNSPLTVADVKLLSTEYKTNVVPLQTNAQKANQLEHRLSNLVIDAYGLTKEEVQLMWDTAPPRMPISPPK